MSHSIFTLSIAICFSIATDGELRLAGGDTNSSGRVEVYHRGEWGTVCDDGWGITDAHVVCRQLGYSRATSAPGRAFFGRGSGPIHYKYVTCTGSETRLADCSQNGLGRYKYSCYHYEDAGVVCDTTQGELILCLLSLNSSTVFCTSVVLLVQHIFKQ